VPGRDQSVNVEIVVRGDLPITVARPTGEPLGGVVVAQEAFGVNEHITDVATRFAKAGYLAAAPHLFYRTGDPTIPYGDRETVSTHMNQLTGDNVLADVDSTIAYLGEAGLLPDRVGIVGFCMGGTVAFYTAATRSIGAAVTFYGGGVAEGRFGMKPMTDYAAELRTPWLGMYGALDQGIPVASVEALKAAASQAPVPTKVVLYEGADHGFHCDARPAVFNPEAAQDAWSRTLNWFASHLAS